MFPGQVNFKELFSNPGAYLSSRTVDQFDSQRDSQLPCSQVDFPDSQDQLLSSQNSQSNASNSPGKKFYSRYGGSRGLTRQNSQENLRSQLSSAVRLTNQQLQNNIAKAKDRDERDFLNSILGSVRETSSEVLSAISAVREKLQLSEKATDGQIEGCFLKIQDIIERYHKEMWCALEVKEQNKDELINLRQDLLQRDTVIAQLENQLEAAHNETNSKLVDKLTQISEIHHKKTQEKIKEFCNILKQDMKDYAERQHVQQLSGLKDTRQHLRELGKLQENQLKDSNTRIGQKIQQILQQSKTVNEKVGKDMKDNIKNVQKQLKSDVEKLLDKQLNILPSRLKDNSDSEEYKIQIYRLLENHKLDLSIRITEQLETLMCSQEQTLTDVVTNCLITEKDSNEEKFQQIQENIQQRIEDEITKLEQTYRDQMAKVMCRLKTLAPPTTPKLPTPLIPPPTPEQFKEFTLATEVQLLGVAKKHVQSLEAAKAVQPLGAAKEVQPVEVAKEVQPLEVTKEVQLLEVAEREVQPLEVAKEVRIPTVAAQTQLVEPEAVEEPVGRLRPRVTRSSVHKTQSTQPQCKSTDSQISSGRRQKATSINVSVVSSNVEEDEVVEVIPEDIIDGEEVKSILSDTAIHQVYQSVSSLRNVNSKSSAISPAIVSKNMWSSNVFSENYTSGRYSSPVATVLPQLVKAKPSDPRPRVSSNIPAQALINDSEVVQPGSYQHLEDFTQDEDDVPVIPVPKPRRRPAKQKAKGRQQHINSEVVQPSDQHLENFTQDEDDVTVIPVPKPRRRRPAKQKAKGRQQLINSEVVQPSDQHLENFTQEPDYEEYDVPVITVPKPKGKPAKKRVKRRQHVTMKKKRKIPEMVPVTNTVTPDESDIDEPDYSWDPVEADFVASYAPNPPQYCEPSRAIVHHPENGSQYSFKKAYQSYNAIETCGPDRAAYHSRQMIDRHPVMIRPPLPPKTYNRQQWSQKLAPPPPPQMTSYTYSYSSTLPAQDVTELYSFQEDSPLYMPKKQVTYNGHPWKRPKSYGSHTTKKKSRNQVTDSEACWQIACDVSKQDNAQPKKDAFKELAVIPYKKMSEEKYLSDHDEDVRNSAEQEDYSLSRESSPAMSVTEVIIKRKFRKKIKTPEPIMWPNAPSDEDINEPRGEYDNGNHGDSNYGLPISYDGYPPQQGESSLKGRKLYGCRIPDIVEENSMVTTEVLAVKRSIRQPKVRSLNSNY